MNYKLINRTTNEEHICQKVAIDGFDYYVSDEIIKDVRPFKGRWQIEKGYILNTFPTYLTDLSECRLVIATNNPSIDIPKVISESMLIEKMVNNLTSHLTHPEERRFGFINGYNLAKEVYSFNKKDMIEFGNWYCDVFLNDVIGLNGEEAKAKVAHLGRQGVTKDIVQIWKEQQPKIVYYEKSY